jgi:hypothetical protein
MRARCRYHEHGRSTMPYHEHGRKRDAESHKGGRDDAAGSAAADFVAHDEVVEVVEFGNIQTL